MMKALIVEPEPSCNEHIAGKIRQHCPHVEVVGSSSCLQDVPRKLATEDPDVLFVDTDTMSDANTTVFDELKRIDFRTIIVSQMQQYALAAIRSNSAAYLLKPIEKGELVAAVEKVQKQLEAKRKIDAQLSLLESLMKDRQCDELIGIPSVKGYDYVNIGDIVCCEGLQKCTRIITTTKTNIVSSYSLGHFRKVLSPFRFFSPHRSYLINLKYVKQYCREGTIHMVNDVAVPIAKRHKEDFLTQLLHI
ncbi:MAG: LytTR family DNA-binding domain-containing protein [Bacteroidota bacterium]